jgi:hypothetical protein
MKKYNVIAALVLTVFVLNARAMGKDDPKSGADTGKSWSKFFGNIKSGVTKITDGIKSGATSVKDGVTGGASNIMNGIKDGVKKCPEQCAIETIKKAYTTFILDPLIINPIKNILYPESKAEKMQKETIAIITLAEQINKLKAAGASRKYISILSAQLAKKIEDSSSRWDSDKGKK